LADIAREYEYTLIIEPEVH